MSLLCVCMCVCMLVDVGRPLCTRDTITQWTGGPWVCSSSTFSQESHPSWLRARCSAFFLMSCHVMSCHVMSSPLLSSPVILSHLLPVHDVYSLSIFHLLLPSSSSVSSFGNLVLHISLPVDICYTPCTFFSFCHRT